MADEGVSVAAKAVWDRQSAWSQAADAAKQVIGRARTRGLLLGIAAAVFATAAAQLMTLSSVTGRALAFLSAASAGLVPVAVSGALPAAVQAWIRLRSVSEALKGETYTFLAGVAPYRGKDPALLLDRTTRIIADASDLVGSTASFISMDRPLPALIDMSGYVDIRVRRQIRDYYRPRAQLMARRVALIKRVEVGLAALAALVGAAVAVFGIDQLSAWVATITTVAAAVTAHAAAARYAYQQLEFTRTAAELENLLTRYVATDAPTPDDDDDFVERCELVISVQNEAWMAKWSVV